MNNLKFTAKLVATSVIGGVAWPLAASSAMAQ